MLQEPTSAGTTGRAPAIPAVALLIYNRPRHTARVIEALRVVAPPTLFLIGDGPRPGAEGRVAEAREALRAVDWPCVIRSNLASENLGCATRVSSGLDWLFSQTDRAIILEDDCVPDPSFFRYCAELLERYADDERIMAISGNNFQRRAPRTEASYYFSRYPHCWGWATWRRAWSHYDHAMAAWPAVRDQGWLQDILGNAAAVRYWANIFDRTAAGEIDSWAYRWTLACWLQGGLTTLPAVNLVKNIGFGDEATHTRGSEETPESGALSFPLRHPPFVIRDAQADDWSEREHFRSIPPALPERILRKARRLAARLRSGAE